MIGIGVVGYGYWGPNLVRNFAMTEGASIAAVCDGNPARRATAQRLYPAISVYADLDEMLADPKVDAVIIATPVTTHFALALTALRAGRHVLVEKPMTATVQEATILIDEAQSRGLVLMVDHTFVYTSAVRKIAELVTSGDLGRLHYYDSVRVNLGLFQSDVNVVWDLAVHDLSIMDHLLQRSPVTISATGMAHAHGQPENMAYITCYFDDDFIGHFHVNWLAPVKLRQTLICGSDKMIVYDDIEMSEKVKVYDKGIILDDQATSVQQRHVGYRTGDMWAPRIDNVEALAIEAAHFLACIDGNEQPMTGGDAGLRVVRILEAATASLADRGRPVDL